MSNFFYEEIILASEIYVCACQPMTRRWRHNFVFIHILPKLLYIDPSITYSYLVLGDTDKVKVVHFHENCIDTLYFEFKSYNKYTLAKNLH